MLSNYTYTIFKKIKKIKNKKKALQWAFKLNKAPAMA
jgi:hypothetical protein